jgi:hypothetical protein
VRYHGAVAPNSPLRGLLVRQAREAAGAPAPEPEPVVARARRGWNPWAAAIARVFEVDPLLCLQCGGRLLPVAAVLDDEELVRLLGHLGLPMDFPKLAPPRGPLDGDEDTQVDPRVVLNEGIDAPHGD